MKEHQHFGTVVSTSDFTYLTLLTYTAQEDICEPNKCLDTRESRIGDGIEDPGSGTGSRIQDRRSKIEDPGSRVERRDSGNPIMLTYYSYLTCFTYFKLSTILIIKY